MSEPASAALFDRSKPFNSQSVEYYEAVAREKNPPAVINHSPRPLESLQEPIKAQYARVKNLGMRLVNMRDEWILETLALAKMLAEAREIAKSNKFFGQWLDHNKIDLSRNVRAALIQMGNNLEISRKAMERSQRISIETIWNEDIKPLLEPPHLQNDSEDENPPPAKPKPKRAPLVETLAGPDIEQEPQPEHQAQIPAVVINVTNAVLAKQGFQQYEEGLEMMARGILDKAEAILEMRDQFETDLAFAHWLVENEETGNGPTFADLMPPRKA